MVRKQARAAEYPVRRGDRKKLRIAFRWRLTGEGENAWLNKLKAENPEEADFIAIMPPPPEAEIKPWFGLYFRAWEDLRFDRFYGAMGGEGPISYVAISAYAKDQGIAGEDFRLFRRFVQAIDLEWLSFVSERESSRRSQGHGGS